MFDLFKFYEIESNAKLSDWVVERCVGPKDTLHTVVPAGFSSYARICQPAWYADPIGQDDEATWKAFRAGWIDSKKRHPVRWSDVAKANGNMPHRLMQWYQIFSPEQCAPGSGGIDPPLEGDLTKDMVKEIFSILTSLYGDNQYVQCGFWEGFNRSEYYCAKTKIECFPGQQYYYLFNSSISKARDGWLDALQSIEDKRSIGTNGLAPNAIWATDKSWFFAVPYNLRSSYIGGSKELVERILGAPLLETYDAFSGDKVYVFKSSPV